MISAQVYKFSDLFMFQSLIGIQGFSGFNFVGSRALTQNKVSIPDRDLGFFRRRPPLPLGGSGNTFQSLIGIQGFSGSRQIFFANEESLILFQSLIGIQGFSGLLQVTRQIMSDLFQSLIGIQGFSGADCWVWLVGLGLNVSIPDRDLGFFRPFLPTFKIQRGKFQSLIGIQGFSGLERQPRSGCLFFWGFNP